MIKYAVKYLKNTFHPLIQNGDGDIKEDIDGKLILARTEKGEEVLKAFLVNKCIACRFEKAEKQPEAFEFLRVMTQEDLMIYEELIERGLIAQTTNEEKIRELLNNGGAKFYI